MNTLRGTPCVTAVEGSGGTRFCGFRAKYSPRMSRVVCPRSDVDKFTQLTILARAFLGGLVELHGRESWNKADRMIFRFPRRRVSRQTCLNMCACEVLTGNR